MKKIGTLYSDGSTLSDFDCNSIPYFYDVLSGYLSVGVFRIRRVLITDSPKF